VQIRRAPYFRPKATSWPANHSRCTNYRLEHRGRPRPDIICPANWCSIGPCVSDWSSFGGDVPFTVVVVQVAGSFVRNLGFEKYILNGRPRIANSLVAICRSTNSQIAIHEHVIVDEEANVEPRATYPG